MEPVKCVFCRKEEPGGRSSCAGCGKPLPAAGQLRLAYDHSRRLTFGRAATVRLRLDYDGPPLEFLGIEVLGDSLEGGGARLQIAAVGPRTSREFPLQVRALELGEIVLEVRTRLLDELARGLCLRGPIDVEVVQDTGPDAHRCKPAIHVNIQADRILGADFSNLARAGEPPSSPDNRPPAPDWREIALAPDRDATRELLELIDRDQLVDCPYCFNRIARMSRSCPQCGIDCPSYLSKRPVTFGINPDTHPPARCLVLEQKGSERKVYLYSGEKLRLGRQRERNDIVLRVVAEGDLDRGEADAKSVSISRSHARLAISGDRVVLVSDKPLAVNGVELAGPRPGKRVLASGDRLTFASVLELAYEEFRDPKREVAVDKVMRRANDEYAEDSLDELSGGPAPRGLLQCFRLTRCDNGAGAEEYVALHRTVRIGSAASDGLRFCGPGVARGHAKLVRLRGHVWIHGSGPAPLSVNGQRLGGDEIALLAGDGEIRLGPTAIRVQRRDPGSSPASS